MTFYKFVASVSLYLRHRILFGVMRIITPCIYRDFKPFPRAAVEFAKEHFKGKLVDCVEIGVARGWNSRSILKTLNVKMLYCIDPYVEYVSSGGVVHSEYVDCFKKAQRWLRPWFQKVRFLLLKSHIAVNYFPSVDFVYIDGDHEYEFVKRDLRLYWEKLRKGGILSGHDFTPYFPGVVRAVVEFADQHSLELTGKMFDWWFVKGLPHDS